MGNSVKRPGGGSGDWDEAPGLDDVLADLRADVPVRAAWRDDVLGEVRELARSGTPGAGRNRGWTISPPTAIAAALAFTALGATAAVGVLSIRDHQSRIATTKRPEGVTPQPAHPPGGGYPRSPEPVVRFALVAPGASRVSLVGDFNRWDAAATPMRQLGDGRLWLVEVPLPPGRHVYAFVVDGDVTPDPAAPRAGDEDFGVPSSVVLVGTRGL
jgi:Carbohydrate-binding module 48 (Isoamylase N-terminal domain)